MTNKALRYRLEAAAAMLPLGLFKVMGLDRASAAGGWLFRTVGPKVGVTRRARTNIERAMPELGPAEIDAIIADMWENIGRTVAEYAHLEKFRTPAYRDRITVKNLDTLLAQKERGAMIVSGHFANWELMPLVADLNGLKGAEIYRHINNPHINRWIVGLRSRAIFPVQVAKGPKGAREIIRIVRNHGFIGMLADQKMNDGVEAQLFGRKAMSPATPGSLAVRYGIPIVPASFRRTEGAHFEQVFHDPIEADRDADPHEEIARLTQRVNDFLEAEIRANPAQWLWLHNRWPKDA
ncbi:MAG: lysophospholipid acyltransferase family protein [Parvibaculaceae bacterium]